MYPLSLSQVASDLQLQSSSKDIISKVIIDSREAEPNCLFFALKGTKVDGHNYVKQVIDQGGFAVVKGGFGSGERILNVPEPLLALQQLAAAHLKRISIPIVAITGSNGKTTTKDLTAAVLSSKFNVHKTQGNFNNALGLPLTIMELEPHHQIIVLEMGMRGLGQIKSLAKIAPPDVAVITNVGPVHLEVLKSIENITKAKAEILSELKHDGTAILNGDDQLVRRHCITNRNKLYFGSEKANKLCATDIDLDHDGNPSYTAHWCDQSFPVKLNIPGKHNVYNSLAAIGVGLQFGIDFQECIANLKYVSLSEMRLTIESGKNEVRIINDVYNASLASMSSSLDTLKHIRATGRKIAVLGDMLELGVLTEEAHGQIGFQAANICDFLIFVGQYAHFLKKGALEAGFPSTNIRIYETTKSLIENIDQLIQPNDLVLVKASRGVALEQVVTELKER